MRNQQYRHTSEELENLLRNDSQAFKITAKYYYENNITFFKSVVVPIIEDLKTNPDKYKTPPPQEIVESSLNLLEENKSYKKHIIITIVIIFLFVIIYLAIKDSQNNQKTNTNISIQKDTTTRINKPSINGVYEGYARDKQMYMVINNFDGKNFIGYCVIYWSSTKGTKAEFKGNYDETKDSIYIYESNDIKGAGKFEGALKQTKLLGNWYRYSDNGNYNWNLNKVNKTETTVIQEYSEMEKRNLEEKEKKNKIEKEKNLTQKNIDEKLLNTGMVIRFFSPYNEQMDCFIEGVNSQYRNNYFTFDLNRMILTWENATTYSTCKIIFTGIEIREINNERIKFLCWRTTGSKIGLKEIAYGEKKDYTIGYLVLKLIVSDCFIIFTVTDIN